MKIATVLGTRPHFIKAAAVSRAIQRSSDMDEVIIHSGQHYSTNMDAVFFEQLGIPVPDYRFDVNNADHAAMVGRIIEMGGEALKREKRDCVIVYGDTNTTLAGAVAAKVLHLPLMHVEAGLRSFDSAMQEEVNRVMVDRLSDILFCPTQNAVNNLNAEGFSCGPARVVNCGDVMLDAVRLFRPKARPPHGLESLERGGFLVSTVHRAETTDSPARLVGVLRALDELSRRWPVVLPLHPRTRKMVANTGFDLGASAIRVIEPVGYLEMLWLVDNAAVLITDSGGLQKEAYFLETPCATLRNCTEWTELVDAGANLLVGTVTEDILAGVDKLVSRNIDYCLPFYGLGYANERIVSELHWGPA